MIAAVARTLIALLVVSAPIFFITKANPYWHSVQQISVSGSGPATCTESNAWITRALAAYAALAQATQDAFHVMICGLVTDTDGTDTAWSLFDAFYMFAAGGASGDTTPSADMTRLNIKQNAFNLTKGGTPTFTAAGSGVGGWTGTDGSTSIYLDTGFVPITEAAGTGKMQQNSASIMTWINNNAASGSSGGTAIGTDRAFVSYTHIYPKFQDGNTYYRIVDNITTPSAGKTRSTSVGFFVATRSGASAQKGYYNTTDESVTATTSDALGNASIYILASHNDNSGAVAGDGHENMFAAYGKHVSPTNETNIFNRVNCFLRTIPGISYTANTC